MAIPRTIYGIDANGRIYQFVAADVVDFLFASGSDTAIDLNARNVTANGQLQTNDIYAIGPGGIEIAPGVGQPVIVGSPGQNPWSVDVDGNIRAKSFVGAGVLPSTVIYTSQIADLVADFNPTTSAGTDNTSRIQSLVAGGNKVLVFDSPNLYGVKGQVQLESSTAILSSRPGAGIGKIGRPNLGQPVFVNKNFVPANGADAPTDHDIIVAGLYVDGNRRGYGSGNSAVNGTHKWCNNSNVGVPIFAFCGVDRLRLQDNYVFDPPWGAYMLTNLRNSSLRDCGAVMDPASPAPPDVGCAILFVDAGNQGLLVDGLYGKVDDDAIQITDIGATDAATINGTANPYLAGYAPTFGHATLGTKIINTNIAGCLHAVRFISCRDILGLIDCTIDNLSATVVEWGAVFSSFGVPGLLGFYDQIKMLNWNIKGGSAAVPGGAIYLADGLFGNIEARGVYSEHPKSIVWMGGAVQGTAGALLKVSSLKAGGATPTLPLVHIDGSLPVIEIGEHEVTRDPPAAGAAIEVVSVGLGTTPTDVRTGRLVVKGGKVRGTNGLVNFTGYSPQRVLVSDCDYDGPAAAVRSDTALSCLVTSGIAADYITDIPGGSVVKHDGAGIVAAAMPAWLKADLAILIDFWEQRPQDMFQDAPQKQPVTTNGQTVTIEWGRWRRNGFGGAAAGDTSPTYSAPGTRNALAFSGTQSKLMAGAGQPLGAAHRSMACWIHPTALGTQMAAVGYGTPTPNTMFHIGILDTGVPYVNNFNVSALGAGAVTAGVWTHLLGTWDGTNLQMYVNGVLTGTQAATVNTVIGDGNVYFGRQPAGTNWTGLLAGLRLYSDALTAQMASDLFAAGV